MAEQFQTKIIRLHHDAHTSARIGFLASQHRLAYNWSVSVLNRMPNAPMWSNTSSPIWLNRLLLEWRKEDRRVAAPLWVHQAGAFEAWLQNRLLGDRRVAGVHGALRTQEREVPHRRTLAYRSRKHDTSPLTSLLAPIRIDECTFTLAEARDIVMKTREPVPEHMDIRAFRLVEVRRHRRGFNGRLGKRRYALHLRVAGQYPEPVTPDSIEDASGIVGMVEPLQGHALFSTGHHFCDDTGAERSRNRNAIRVSGKKKKSRRRAKALRKAAMSSRRSLANSRRIMVEGTKRVLEDQRLKAVAVEQSGVPPNPHGSDLGHTSSSGRANSGTELASVLENSSVSAKGQILAAEARKQGLEIYVVLPRPESLRSYHTTWESDDSDNQAVVNCHPCRGRAGPGLDRSQILRNRAFLMASIASGRRPSVESAPQGRRVRPSREPRVDPRGAHDAIKPKGGVEPLVVGNRRFIRRVHLQGAPPQVCSPELGVQRPLTTDDPIHRYVITFLPTLPIEVVLLLHRIVDEDLADKTKALYVSGMASWVQWAITAGCPIMPAKPRHLALYFAMRAEAGYKHGGLQTYATGISSYHRIHRLPSPVTRRVSRLLRGIKIHYGKGGRQAPGLLAEHLDTFIKTPAYPLRGESPEGTRHRRGITVALIALMRDAMLRPSEAAALTWADIEDAGDGYGIVVIRKSKTDPHGKGDYQPITPNTMAYLAAIRGDAGHDDMVFGLDRGQASKRIRSAMKSAGFGKGFSGHSPRRGSAMERARDGRSLEGLKRDGRWDSDEMAVHYARTNLKEFSAVYRYYENLEERCRETRRASVSVQDDSQCT